jgi:Lrp/AsnC family transcriptional regulator, regulator for asnA, asnC and gidA
MSSVNDDSASDIVPVVSSDTEIRTTETPPTPSGPAPARGGRLDDIDRDIIRALQRDGRTSNTEIGRALGLAETTIRKRIARLIAEDLVNIVAVPTPEAVGMTTSAIIGISVALAEVRDVSERLVAWPEVRYVGFSTGRYELIIEAFFNDHEHLLDFVTTKLGGLPGVTGVETSLILKVAKFSYEWEIP